MTALIKRIVQKHFASFGYFYSYLRYRIFVVLVFSILVGVLDGFGLAMFLPLLNLIADSGGGAASAEQMGNLSFILEIITGLGLELTLTVVLSVMLLFFLLKGGFKFLASYYNVVYQQYFIRRIRVSNILALSRFRYDLFVAADVGRIQNTMSGEVERVKVAYSTYMQMIQQTVMVMVYTVLAVLSNWQFALLVAVGGVFTNSIFRTLYKKTKLQSRKLTKNNHGFQGLIIQQVAFFKYLKATGLIRDYARQLIRKVHQIEASQRKIGILNGILGAAREPLLIGVVVAAILIQVKVLGGSLGLIILSILFFYRALGAIIQLQTSYNRFLSMSGSLENLTAFTRELRKGSEKQGMVEFDRFEDRIRLDQVSFAYGAEPILDNITLELNKDETLALVGESGSGKTTLVNILCGLLPPRQGNLYVDGTDIISLNLATFQRRIGYITQDPVIYNDTLFNNVSFWDEQTPENLRKFKEVLRKASMWDFVQRLPHREATVLGINGINLSGGQKQRLSIARELYKDIDILIMDEATSALDSETERSIQQSIDSLKGSLTMVIVAHRLSTIKNADRIALMENGEILSVLPFDELVEKEEKFRKMVLLQGI